MSGLTAEADTGELRILGGAVHVAGKMKLDTGNFGCNPDLVYPTSLDGEDLLYISAPWVSAKRYRRNAAGMQLYWLTYPPTAQNNGMVAQGDSGWNPSLVAVLDTLTSIGFDGDLDLYELLPAYNPLVAGNAAVADLYAQYSPMDTVLKSILGEPAPREFAYPDPLGTYCFTQPQAGGFATPGLETHSSYYYDFCPFETLGDRDWGTSRSQNSHYPLGIAVHQESYAWSPLPVADFVVIKRTIYNTSAVDTLYDIALGSYVDADMGAQTNQANANDDVSGYVKGAGYEFAYSYDFDGDEGAAPYYLGNKILVPGLTGNRFCWYWNIGDGPDDYHPLSLDYGSHQTPNEKYWLMTGRNPGVYAFAPLRPLEPDVLEYEQPNPRDTRYMSSLCGSVPSAGNPNPAGRWNLAPGASLTYYSVLFAGSDLNDLKLRSQALETFIAGNFDLGNTATQPCIPYLISSNAHSAQSVEVAWHSYSDPDHFLLRHRLDGTSDWTETQVTGSEREYILGGLQGGTAYDFQMAAVYDPGANETVLESEILHCATTSSANDDATVPALNLTLKSWPNPFTAESWIRVEAWRELNGEVSVFNLRGQKVKSLHRGTIPKGSMDLVWDGRDAAGLRVGPGIYLVRADWDGSQILIKILKTVDN